MPQYIIRDLDQRRWIQFRARAQREGWHLRALFDQLIDDYGSGRIRLSKPASARPDIGSMPLLCQNGHATMQVFSKEEAADWLKTGHTTLACLNCGVDVTVTQEERDNLESWVHTPSSEYDLRKALERVRDELIAIRDEAQRLIDSNAKYLDPHLALDKAGPDDLYTRFVNVLSHLRRRQAIADDQLPDSTFWAGRWTDAVGVHLSRLDLSRLVGEANRVLVAIHQRLHSPA